MSEISCEEIVSTLLPKLRSKRVTYFPIRHHSPACAAHIERWILENKPSAVLIEGPGSFSSRISFLVDHALRCPVALYTNFIDKKGRLDKIFALARKSGAADGGTESGAGGDGESHDRETVDLDSTGGAKDGESAASPKDGDHGETSEEKEPKSVGESDGEPDPTGKKGKRAPKPELDLDFGPPRFAAYYPFCDYSPELIALRTGNAVGARLRFIDLEFGEMILARMQGRADAPDDLVHIESLTQDAHLTHSHYITALAEKMGCRDFDELWDHLFETGWQSLSTDAFMDRLATYCAMARLDYSDEELIADGTARREACMAQAICEELDQDDGQVLVVTGGFHTVVLPDLVAKKTKRPAKPDFTEGEVGTWLMRYSFDKLDSLAGYSAGMPAPAYYDRLWNVSKTISEPERNKQFERIAADVLLDISRLTRERSLPNLITTPDSIAAAQMSQQLAMLRGHAWPMREDILDGIRSCFVKGEVSVEGQALLALVNEVMAGNRIGDLPEGADLPPIVDDFYREAKRFRFTLDYATRKEHSLDLYRNAMHRQISRFLHRLDFLGVSFARFVSGPDFVTGQSLTLMQEHWESSWSPVVESGLIEKAVLGTSIEEAADSKLKLQIAKLQQEGEARSASAAVTLLVRACRLGLHAQMSLLVPLIDIHIAEDSQFPSVVQGLSQLELLLRAREPLEASNLTAVPRLMEAAYVRACRLLHDVVHCPDSEVDQMLGAMQTLREILSSTTPPSSVVPRTSSSAVAATSPSAPAPPTTASAAPSTSSSAVAPTSPSAPVSPTSESVRVARKPPSLHVAPTSPSAPNPIDLDRDLFFQGLRTIIDSPPFKAQSAIVGGAAGILYAEAKLDEDELVRVVCGFLGGAISDPRKTAGILRGLLTTACEIAWQVGEIMRAMDAQFQSWDEKTFVELLPDLRLAFSSLAPRDIARVADRISGFHDGKSLGELVHVDVDERDVQFGISLNEKVREALKADGIGNGAFGAGDA